MKKLDWPGSGGRRPSPPQRRGVRKALVFGVLLAVAVVAVLAATIVTSFLGDRIPLSQGKPPGPPVVNHQPDPDAAMSAGAEPDAPPYIVPPEWRGPGDGGPSTMGKGREAELAARVKQYDLKLVSSYSTNYYHAIPSQENNIALAADRLRGALVEAGETFSQNRRLGPYTEEHGYGLGRMFVGDRIVPSIGGGVCQVASTLYNASLLAGLQIVERHPHGLVVPYLTPGRDATVTDTSYDFQIKNTSGGRILIWAWGRNRWLTVQVYAEKETPKVAIKTEILKVYKFQTITTLDAAVPRGQTVVDAGGQDGARSHTWLEIQTPQGLVTKDLGIDDYKASPRIVRVNR